MNSRVNRILGSQGFTLLELMIVVAVVAILAAIAYPAYTDSILKGRRAQGRTALLELAQQQERYMTQNNTYLDFTNAAGTTTNNASTIFKVFAGDTATNTSYWLSAAACNNPSGGLYNLKDCVLLTAAPTKADPAAGSLSITSTGIKSCTGSNPSLCWP